ncbi:MAG: carbon-nitrogen hydrolase family protein [bacterium]
MAVNKIGPNFDDNLNQIELLIHDAASSKSDFVLFPECAMTGLINNDDPDHDLPLGQPVPGQLTERMSQLAQNYQMYIGIGLLEKDAGRLFDSGVILSPDGAIVLHYRRMSPFWHGKKADPEIYCQGDEIKVANTEFGSFTFMICGDIFDDEVLLKVKKQNVEYILCLLYRTFDDGSIDQEKWDFEEESFYAARALAANATVFFVNSLEDHENKKEPSFGCALAVNPEGRVMGKLPLGKSGLLILDL